MHEDGLQVGPDYGRDLNDHSSDQVPETVLDLDVFGLVFRYVLPDLLDRYFYRALAASPVTIHRIDPQHEIVKPAHEDIELTSRYQGFRQGEFTNSRIGLKEPGCLEMRK